MSPCQLKEGALLEVVDKGVSSSPLDRIDRKEPKTEELGRWMLGRILRDGRRILEGEECREGGLLIASMGISGCSTKDAEGVRRFRRVLAGSFEASSFAVGLICVREESPKMVFLLGLELPSRPLELGMFFVVQS